MTADRRWVRRPEGSNWGDFGPDDQLGRMNLLTPARRLEAIKEVKAGLSFALSLPLDRPFATTGHRKPPRLMAARHDDGEAVYNMPMGIGTDSPLGVVCDDAVLLHTQYSTQWDALSHWGSRFDADDDGVDEKVYYNGFKPDEHLVGPVGDGAPQARALGIENLAATGVQGRAAVVSLLAAFGPGRTWVGFDELQQALSDQAVGVRTGDFLLLHTGYDDAVLSMTAGDSPAVLNEAGAVLDGRDPRLLEWVADSGVVALCSDNKAVEGYGFDDCSAGHHSMLPLHDLCLFRLGIHLGELWLLRDLSQWLLKEERSACFLTAPPLRLPGAVGSPVTPVATV